MITATNIKRQGLSAKPYQPKRMMNSSASGTNSNTALLFYTACYGLAKFSIMAKAKTKTEKLRKPYYELSDAVSGFKSATVGTDAKLKGLAKKMSDLQDQIFRHLQSHYIWD
jgi:organic hydroperoxide reductase OsmC/OhrA